MSDYHCPKHGVRWWDYSHDASNPDLRCIQCEIERAESAESQLRQVKADAERTQQRYMWAANELLACDYGDNDTGRMGWRVYGWRGRGGERRIYGDSITQAIDAELP